jgi:hypothetical protein
MRKILSMLVAIAGLAIAAHITEETPGGTPDGTLTTFTLASPPVPSSIAVYANGLRNYQGVDYDQVGQALVFRAVSIPQPGWTLRVDYDTVPAPVTITIDAGGPGDKYFSPADGCFAGRACAYSDPGMGPAPYDTLRYGFGMLPFAYQIPAPNGACDVTLGFSEPNKTAAGQRVFTITTNDQTVADVDIFARAGLKTPTTIELGAVQVTDGFLHLTFTAKPNTWNALVNSISAICQPNP